MLEKVFSREIADDERLIKKIDAMFPGNYKALSHHHTSKGESVRRPVGNMSEVEFGEGGLRLQCSSPQCLTYCKIFPKDRWIYAVHFIHLCFSSFTIFICGCLVVVVDDLLSTKKHCCYSQLFSLTLLVNTKRFLRLG